MNIDQALRRRWHALPEVVIHNDLPPVKSHSRYLAAKAGDLEAADVLVADTLSDQAISRLHELIGNTQAVLVPVHALETTGVNAIPSAMAAVLSLRLQWPVHSGIVQTNRVGHTGADGWSRFVRQALFDGPVPALPAVLVDDFIGMGGTYANLHGHIIASGSSVLAATALTGKPHSATFALHPATLEALREKHGILEDWWREVFGFGFDLLTESEARYLCRAEDAQRIRDQLAAAASQGIAGAS